MVSRYISPRSVRRTLRFSVADGAAFAGMVGLTPEGKYYLNKSMIRTQPPA